MESKSCPNEKQSDSPYQHYYLVVQGNELSSTMPKVKHIMFKWYKVKNQRKAKMFDLYKFNYFLDCQHVSIYFAYYIC